MTLNNKVFTVIFALAIVLILAVFVYMALDVLQVVDLHLGFNGIEIAGGTSCAPCVGSG